MKKLLSFIVLLAFCSTLSFGQNLGVKPSKISANKTGSYQNLNQYFEKNTPSNTKVSLLNEGFEGATFPPSGWTKQNTSAAAFQWVSGTISHTGTKCASVDYEPTPLAQNEWLITPSLNLSTVTNPSLKFWWSMSYYWGVSPNPNYDFRVKITTDNGTTWTTIWTEDSAGVFDSFTYYQKLIPLTNYASNTVKIAFQYQGQDGGALYLDDVVVEEMVANNLTADRVTYFDAYTQIPTGLGLPIYTEADISNLGVNAQTHVKLHSVDLSTGTEMVSADTTILSNRNIVEWELNDYFFTPPTTIGTYKVTSYLSSDAIPRISLDTFDIKVCNTCNYSRDNNTYTGSRWAGATGTTSDAYTAANRFQVNQDRMTYGANCVVGSGTKVGSKIKAVLYKYFAASATRTIVAQSANYFITSADIPTAAGVNPTSITLAFTAGYTMQKDSMYWVGIQVFGGTDTVTIAIDDTGIPQYEQTSLYFDPATNTWYIWESGNVPAMMIRSVVDPIIGINEINNSVNLFSCMPNPANNTTQISYELKNNEKVSIIITDIAGRIVKTLNQGTQTKGNYSVDLDLSNLTSGTYFYTLKTATAQATEKLIVVKR